MSILLQLQERSQQHCELCNQSTPLEIYAIPPLSEKQASTSLFLCKKCIQQIDKKETLDPTYWTFLNQTMWSEIPAVQIVSWRMLQRLKNETWANEALDLMYLDEENETWAKAMGDHIESGEATFHQDAFGNILQNGDSVVLTKSLDVKGSSVNAKIGTVVKNIKLVSDNKEQIEGKIDNQVIVILTQYLRKSN